MKTAWLVGGPLVVAIGFSFWSGILAFGETDGLEHKAGATPGGTLVMQEDVYQCDEGGNNCVLVESNTEFSEIDGLEIEQESIEYREGDEQTTVRKQPGIAKYTNITFRRPTGFDWKSLRFTFEREAALQKVRDEYDAENKNADYDPTDINGDMIQIDPPVLVIPAR